MAILRSLGRQFQLKRRPRFFSTDGLGANTSKKLEGKVVVITGGASGLGKATAREFIWHGAIVVIADSDAERGAHAAKELGPASQFGDVAVEAQVAEAVETAVRRHGKLDVMYNNAGIVGPLTPPSIADLDLTEFERTMQINVGGVVAGIKHAAWVMIPAGSGCILRTASIASDAIKSLKETKLNTKPDEIILFILGHCSFLILPNLHHNGSGDGWAGPAFIRHLEIRNTGNREVGGE